MLQIDADVLGDALVAIVREHVTRTLAPVIDQVRALQDRVAALPAKIDPDAVQHEVQRAVAALPAPSNGKDADPVEVARLVIAEVTKAVAAIPAPTNGKDADPDVMRAAVRSEVQRAVAELPKPKDGEPGKTPSADELVPLVKAEVERAVAGIPRPKDGESVHPDTVALMVRNEVEKAAASLPKPENGKDADPELIKAEVLRAVAALPKPENGKNADAAAIAAEVLDQVLKALPVVKDGEDGTSVTVEDVRPLMEAEAARWALDFERRAADVLQHAIDKMPRPKDGADGIKVDAFDVDLRNGRTLVLSLRAGDRLVTKEIELIGMPIDRGVYRSGQSAKAGDGVTYGGSYWIAKQDTSESPTGGSHHWRLAVKGSK